MNIPTQAKTGLEWATRPLVRVAAAATLKHLHMVPVSSAFVLVDDPDPGVRRLTLESLQIHHPAAFKSKIQEIAAKDSDESVRRVAIEILNHLQ